MTDRRAAFLRVLELACAASGNQTENVNNLQRLMRSPAALAMALSVLEDPACDARAHTLSILFIHEVNRRSMLLVTPRERWPSVEARLYALFTRTLQRRCESDNEQLKRDFEIFGATFMMFVRMLTTDKARDEMLLTRAAPGFQLVQSEKISDVICGVEFLNIMFDGISCQFLSNYIQAAAMLAERGSQNLPAFARALALICHGGLSTYVRSRYLQYLTDSNGLLVKILLNSINVLPMAAQQKATIENEDILEMVYETASLLNGSICCLLEKIEDAEMERLFGAIRAQCLEVVVGATRAVKYVVPETYSRKLLSMLLYLLDKLLNDEVGEAGLPEFCEAVLDVSVLYSDDFQDQDVNPNRFYDTAYPDSGVYVGPWHPRRVAMDFLRLLAKHHLSRVLELLLSRPPQENVIYALRVVSGQVRKAGSPEHQQAVVRYLLGVKERKDPMPTCTWMSAASRYAYCQPQGTLAELAELSLQFLGNFAPNQPNENIFFFTVGCVVLYHLMKFGFTPDQRYTAVIVRYGESTASGIGMRLLNAMLQPSDQSREVNEQVMVSMQQAVESLYAMMDKTDTYYDQTDKILATIGFLCDKAESAIQLPTELLCRLFDDKFLGDDPTQDLLSLAHSLFRNQHTPDLFRILVQILEVLKDDSDGSVFNPFGADIATMLCCFVTYQLRYRESVELVPTIVQVVLFFTQKAEYIEDFGPLPKVFAALFQTGIAKPEWMNDAVGVILHSKWRESRGETCNLLILEILASASAFIPDVRMPPEHLAGLVNAIGQGMFSTNYLRHLSVLCLEKHRDCWPADLRPLDEILTAVKTAAIPLDCKFAEAHSEFYCNSSGSFVRDMPISLQKPDPDFVVTDE